MRSLAVFLSAAVLLAVGVVLLAWIVVRGLNGLAEMEDQSCEGHRHNEDDIFCYEPESPPSPW